MSSDDEYKPLEPSSSLPNEDDPISDDPIYSSKNESEDNMSMDDSVHEDLAEYSHTLNAINLREDTDLTRNLLKIAQGKVQDEGRYQIWTRWPLLPQDVPRSRPKYTSTETDQCYSPLGEEILATAQNCIKEHLRQRHLKMDAEELDTSIQNAVVSTGIDDVQRMLDVCRIFRKTKTKDANRHQPLDWKSVLSAAELSGLPKEVIDAARNKLTKIYEPKGPPPLDHLAIMHRLLAENNSHMADLCSDSYTDDWDDLSGDGLEDESEDGGSDESKDNPSEDSQGKLSVESQDWI